MPTYYNQNTNTKVHYAEANARLEALPQWRQVEDDTDGPFGQAAARAEAERDSIEEASKIRRQDSTKYHDEALQIAEASARQTGGVANVTFSSSTPEGYKATEGVLSRAKGDQAAGRLQIGPDPESHPRTREELEAKAAEDSAAIAALAPEQSSVLERAGVDDGIPEPEESGDPDNADDVVDTAAGRTGDNDRDSDGVQDTEEDTDADTDAEGEAVDRPTKSARVAEWRTYAKSVGGDPAEVDSMTRDELITRYGQ